MTLNFKLISEIHDHITQKNEILFSKNNIANIQQIIHEKVNQILKNALEYPTTLEAFIKNDIPKNHFSIPPQGYDEETTKNIIEFLCTKIYSEESITIMRFLESSQKEIQNSTNTLNKAKDKYLQLMYNNTDASYIKALGSKIAEEETLFRNKIQSHMAWSYAHRFETLNTYHTALKENRYIITRSRENIIEQIKQLIINGNSVLITGATGTGKTSIASKIVEDIHNIIPVSGKKLGHELIIAGHEDIRIADIMARQQIINDGNNCPLTITELGKMMQAFVDGHIPIIDEIDLIPNAILMRIKEFFNLKKGDTYRVQEGNGKSYTLKNTVILATANLKSAKHPDRQDIDPAIVRCFESIELPYLTKEELFDLTLTSLGNPNTGMLLPNENTCSKDGIIVRFIESIKEIEANYMGKKSETIDIDTRSNVESYLSKAILETGKFLKMIQSYQYSLLDFESHMRDQIFKFIANTAYPKKDRLILIKIFARYTLIAQDDIPTILATQSDISETELKKNIRSKTKQTNNTPSQYLSPLELLQVDPYEIRKLEKIETTLSFTLALQAILTNTIHPCLKKIEKNAHNKEAIEILFKASDELGKLSSLDTKWMMNNICMPLYNLAGYHREMHESIGNIFMQLSEKIPLAKETLKLLKPLDIQKNNNIL